MPTKCQIDINVDWRKVNRIDVEKMAPILVASFDIECVSSHGDFPVARKDYKKLAYEFFQLYDSKKETIVDLKEYMHIQLMGVFDMDFEGVLSKVFPKYSITTEEMQRLRTKTKQLMDDFLDIASGKLVYKGNEPSSTRVSASSKDEIIKKLTTLFGYYGEIDKNDFQKPEYMNVRVVDTYQDKVVFWKGLFPMLQGDPIIQIGTTVHSYGDKECSYKHVLSVGSCDDIEGVDVESCENETQLIERWCDLINRLDPDVMTGYNIFGFDMSYLYERAIELGIKTKFCKIGRLLDHMSSFQEKMLSSSALGDNIMRFLDMEGRVLIDIMKVVQRDHKLDSYKLDAVANHFMGMNKHDVSPNDIFRLSRGTSADRKVVADYCVQDCALCNHLMMKLEILANNAGMANVCNVPLSYIFMRGQGIKIFSLVAKQCKEDDFLIPTRIKGGIDGNEPEDEDGYEGAIVLEPKTGIYTEDPISVLDYASLYPSSMISENLSHDCYVDIGGKYDNIPGIEYLDIRYDIYEKVDDKKVKAGEKVCRFVQNEKGVIPRILMKLIRQRKETRKKIEYKTITTLDGQVLTGLLSQDDTTYTLTTIDGKKASCVKDNVASIADTYDNFMKAVLDGLQNAYKVTANSLYGQIGARTSPIYLKDIAACTTATGRNMILKAKGFLEENYVGVNIVYGDTDSLFVSFPMTFTDESGVTRKRTGAAAVQKAIDMGVDASSKFKKFLKPPHDLEMEKVFYPFILISKKRYCAMKYENDPKKGKFTSMGIALKRRDNAPIVKKVFGGVIDIIMTKQDINESINFLQRSMTELIDGKYGLEDLIISKSLRADYKDPSRIAHKALADRMGERDPGNKPQVNDRIPYVYVDISNNKTPSGRGKLKVLQGDRIEHPDYIRKNNLKPDYEFYITNQIMKPVSQIYALVLEQVPGYRKGKDYFKDVEKKLIVDKNGDMKKVKDKVCDMRENEVQDILFKPFITKLENKRKGMREITDFFAIKM
jgi:DNA polymerase delta subunit 1